MVDVTILDAVIDPEVLPPYVSFAIIASMILIGVSLAIRGSLKLVPTGMQNFMETVAEVMLNLSEENIGHRWGKHMFPLLGTLFMYILLCNYMGLIPGLACPTSNINTTASMAIPVFIITHVYGIRVHKLNYLKHFVGPMRSIAALPLMILMFFIEVIGHLARPLTLSVRLFGNMVAKHILLLVLALIAPIIVPIVILALGVLVCLIQACVFTLLTAIYLAGAVEEAH